MLNVILRWLIYALLIIFVSWIVPGIEIDNFITAHGLILLRCICCFIGANLYCRQDTGATGYYYRKIVGG